MDIQAAKVIAAGLAALPIGLVGLALGKYFAAIAEAVGRNPSVQPTLKKDSFLYFALVEALALFCFVIAMIILFVV